MWFVTSQKNGVSALGLQRELGLGSYETAWTWLHKLRRAMVRPGRDLLSGTIEVDETYVGGPEQVTRGRETESKAIVAIAVEKNGRGLGRIRLQQIGDVSTDSLLPFVQGAVERGAMVHTDGWRAGLAAAGYLHQVTVLSGGSDPAHEVMPRVHLVASLLKRWLIGTHRGGVQHQHLNCYLDEFTFRFNRRRSKARGLLDNSVERMVVFIDVLKRVRGLVDQHGAEFRSEAFSRLFTTLARELDDDYFALIDKQLNRLKFRNGVLVSAALGKGLKAVDYVLRRPLKPPGNWFTRAYESLFEQGPGAL